MMYALMGCIDQLRVGASPRGDTFHRLAMGVAEQSERVDGERRPTGRVTEDFADLSEVLLKPLLCCRVYLGVHSRRELSIRGLGNFRTLHELGTMLIIKAILYLSRALHT